MNDIDRAWQWVLDARRERIAGEKLIETLRLKERQAIDEHAKVTREFAAAAHGRST